MLAVNATLHREWYAPGDVVQLDVRLCCRPAGESFLSKVYAFVENWWSVSHSSTSSSTTDGKEQLSITLSSLTGRIVGACVVNTRLIQYALEDGKGTTAYHCPQLLDETSLKNHRVYKLFSSDEFTVASDLTICQQEVKIFGITAVLPDNLPPSFKGRSVCFYYGLQLSARCIAEDKKSSLKLLRIPIKVFSSTAVYTPLLLPLSFPLEDFDFGATVVPKEPCTNADTLKTTGSVPELPACRNITTMLAERLAKQKTPIDYPLTISGEVALRVVVTSTTVMIGSSLNAVFLQGDARDCRAVMVLGTLEVLESVLAEHICRGVACLKPLEGDSRLVTQTTVVEEFQWNLMGRPRAPVYIPFTNLNYFATMQTDVVTTSWQLRLRLLWCKTSSSSSFSSGFRNQIAVEEDQPELVVPLTVVPPPPLPPCGIPEHPSCRVTHELCF
uniref:WGS project CAEQ00000000 data, annotated contig 12 n=1 Tax=Trypanosoma congolense (strain IL3000) TaxID=1068625 RepID=F9W549_TRYCI|nr:unnamed protein product [Trypanosoma congolense IL3000]